jgi:hypothetical protein
MTDRSVLLDLASPDYFAPPTMYEEDFINILLPRIVNKDNEKNIDMTIWLTIAGNAHRSINVIDRSNTVLFKVPPLLARVPTVMPTGDRNRVDINSLVHHYGALRAVEHPATADAWFATAMKDSVLSIDEVANINNLKALVIIYARYNIPLDTLLPNNAIPFVTNQPDTSITHTTDETTGEFDEF